MISLEDAVDALKRSGYLIETRVAKVLASFGSHTAVNVVYLDPLTGQSRELDAYCMRAEPSDEVDFLTSSAHLLIECVNNPQPIAFFSSSHTTTTSPVIAARPRWIGLNPIEDGIALSSYHRHFKGKQATNYCTFVNKKNGEWMVTHADEQHQEFTSLAILTQLIKEKQERMLEEYSQPQDAMEMCGIDFICPILVVEGTLLDIEQSPKGEIEVKSIEYVRYVKSHMWKGVQRYCPIDVATERYLPTLLKQIETDCRRTVTALESRIEEIQEAVKSDPSQGGDPAEDSFLP